MCFFNDFENEGSGYIVIGVQESNGKPQRPVLGFNPDSLSGCEKEMIGYCNLFQPNYMPRLSLEEIDKKHVLVIWVPAGSNRRIKCPMMFWPSTKHTITESASIQAV